MNLRDRIVIPRDGETIAISHLLLAIINNLGDGSEFISAAELKIHAPMFAVSLAAKKVFEKTKKKWGGGGGFRITRPSRRSGVIPGTEGREGGEEATEGGGWSAV